MVKILGIDPGLRMTGWGIVSSVGSRLIYVAHGVIKSTQKKPLPLRLREIFEGLHRIISEHKPQEAAVEEVFLNKNPGSTLKLGEARGIALLVPAILDLPVEEYSANRVKKTVVGVGHADKNQVAVMVQKLLMQGEKIEGDAADALAVAICHSHFRTAQNYKLS